MAEIARFEGRSINAVVTEVLRDFVTGYSGSGGDGLEARVVRLEKQVLHLAQELRAVVGV